MIKEINHHFENAMKMIPSFLKCPFFLMVNFGKFKMLIIKISSIIVVTFNYLTFITFIEIITFSLIIIKSFMGYFMDYLSLYFNCHCFTFTISFI